VTITWSACRANERDLGQRARVDGIDAVRPSASSTLLPLMTVLFARLHNAGRACLTPTERFHLTADATSAFHTPVAAVSRT
jgi:hypothetical protein